MQTFFYDYTGLKPNIDLSEYSSISDILFFDIETTGLSPANSFIYLIGAGHYDNQGLHIVQWFGESSLEEPLIINSFFDYTNNFSCLLHFNGQMFDIPFTEKRALRHNINSPLNAMQSVDIYKLIKPYKSILGLQDLRQKTIELFLNVNREDMYSGGELIPIYKKYSMRPNKELLDLLLLHNKEDVYNMTEILGILKYRNLSNIILTYKSHEINTYKDYSQNLQTEIIINATHNLNIDREIRSVKNSIYMFIKPNNTVMLRLPVVSAELKYFFNDYKNYYYLIEQDCIIHKSVAAGIDKSKRKQATKAQCFCLVSESFMPCGLSDDSFYKIFKSDYKSKDLYCLYSDFCSMSTDDMNTFLNGLINQFY